MLTGTGFALRVRERCAVEEMINEYLLKQGMGDPHSKRRYSMSDFQKLAHSIWHCKYHVVWCPKYRFRILTIQAFAERAPAELTG